MDAIEAKELAGFTSLLAKATNFPELVSFEAWRGEGSIHVTTLDALKLFGEPITLNVYRDCDIFPYEHFVMLENVKVYAITADRIEVP